MNPQNIEELVRKVDRRGRKNNHDIARLQELRAELQDDRERRAYTTIDDKSSSIFDDRDISDDYAYHRGGRDELQFNLALRKYDGEQKVRYGVAFHYKRGEHMDDLSTLRTRIALFNKYLRANPEQFSICGMNRRIVGSPEKITRHRRFQRVFWKEGLFSSSVGAESRLKLVTRTS
jgi:hypothetical protein